MSLDDTDTEQVIPWDKLPPAEQVIRVLNSAYDSSSTVAYKHIDSVECADVKLDEELGDMRCTLKIATDHQSPGYDSACYVNDYPLTRAELAEVAAAESPYRNKVAQFLEDLTGQFNRHLEKQAVQLLAVAEPSEKPIKVMRPLKYK